MKKISCAKLNKQQIIWQLKVVASEHKIFNIIEAHFFKQNSKNKKIK